jgi:hypothetical protein
MFEFVFVGYDNNDEEGCCSVGKIIYTFLLFILNIGIR